MHSYIRSVRAIFLKEICYLCFEIKHQTIFPDPVAIYVYQLDEDIKNTASYKNKKEIKHSSTCISSIRSSGLLVPQDQKNDNYYAQEDE